MNDNTKNYPQNFAEGEEKKAGRKVCPICGAELPETAEFCVKCGSKLTDVVEIIDEPISVLYAGPEYFANRGQNMGAVYAGPEIMSGGFAKPEPVMEDVYGGPEPDGLIGKLKGILRK